MIQKIFLLLIGLILGITVSMFLPTQKSPSSKELDELPRPFYKVLWENENIRIVEHRMQPGESEPMHAHPAMLAYIMESSNLLVTESDGATNAVTLTRGEFQELPSWTHSIENIGDTPLHTLLVELKP